MPDFWIFLCDYFDKFCIFGVFLMALFFCLFEILYDLLDFFLDFLDFFWIFRFFEIFWIFLNCIYSFQSCKVTTKSYQGYSWTPQMAKNGTKQHNKLLFCPKGKRALAERQSPAQELEVGPRSGPYLPVFIILGGKGWLNEFIN